MRNRVTLVVLIAVLLLVHPASSSLPDPLDPFSATPSVANAVEFRTIVFPVAGPATYGDTYGACRDGCTRSHQGVDIFAPKLTPLLAASDGRIVSERRNATKKAGNKLVIEDAEGWRYVYLHLNNDTPGTDDDANPQSWIAAGDLRVGDVVQAGQVIGYLGDSGNAEETPPHVHFEITQPGRGAINPTPSVTAARGRGELVTASDLLVSEDIRSDWEPVVVETYRDLAGRPPTADEQAAWTNRLALGLGTETDLLADLAMGPPFREPEGVALRLYVVAFSRLPSERLLTSLANDYRDGASAVELAERIVTSAEYGGLPSTNPNANLDAEALAALADTNDVKIDTWHLLQIVRAYRSAAGRLPTSSEIEGWTSFLERGGLMVDVVAGALSDSTPIGEPRNAGTFSTADLGYEPGETVRQGPIDLDPAADPGDGGAGTRTGGDPELDVALSVDEDDDGTDVANLTVRIPIDELAATTDGDAELTIELTLSPGAGDGADPEASADVDLVIPQARNGGGTRGGGLTVDPSTADDTPGPIVSTPTTRRQTPRPRATPVPSTTTTAAPLAAAAAPGSTTTTAAPTTASSNNGDPPTDQAKQTTTVDTTDPTNTIAVTDADSADGNTVDGNTVDGNTVDSDSADSDSADSDRADPNGATICDDPSAPSASDETTDQPTPITVERCAPPPAVDDEAVPLDGDSPLDGETGDTATENDTAMDPNGETPDASTTATGEPEPVDAPAEECPTPDEQAPTPDPPEPCPDAGNSDEEQTTPEPAASGSLPVVRRSDAARRRRAISRPPT